MSKLSVETIDLMNFLTIFGVTGILIALTVLFSTTVMIRCLPSIREKQDGSISSHQGENRSPVRASSGFMEMPSTVS